MATFNREDYNTALPQLEKKFDKKIEKLKADDKRMHSVRKITPTAYLCTAGTCNVCYKVGNLVFLAFNFNVTTSATATAYLKDIPKPIHNMGCCSSTARFRVDTAGELVSEEAPGTGWHNGSIVYITKE